MVVCNGQYAAKGDESPGTDAERVEEFDGTDCTQTANKLPSIVQAGS